MIVLHNTTIRDFDYPLFVAAYASRFQLSSLQISNRKGIQCGSFITNCLSEFTRFRASNEYSREAVEKYFSIKFNFIRVQKGELKAVEGVLNLGNKIINLHKK